MPEFKYPSVVFGFTIIFLSFEAYILGSRKSRGHKIQSVIKGLFHQTIVFLIVSIFFIVIVGFIEHSTPRYERDSEEITNQVIDRFGKNYGIVMPSRKAVIHSSYWAIGEEFGYDLIVDLKGIHPKETLESIEAKFESINPTVYFRKEINNLQFLCGKVGQGQVAVNNIVLRQLLCSKDILDVKVEVKTLHIRNDWNVTSVYFPDMNILWISETEW